MRIATMPLNVRRLLLGTSALTGIVLAPVAQAGQPGLPTGGIVTAGTATIAEPNASHLAITTGTARTVIDWTSFSIGAGNQVTIRQPGAGSISVNEVTGANPSQIFGDLSSNGQVVLANPNGIWFGPESHVDVAGLVASTATLSDASRKAFAGGGRLALDRAGQAKASIQNDGHLTIAGAGLAALVAPGVRNDGVIQATLGTVQLASGSTATLDFYGDGLVALAVTKPVTAVALGPDGKPFQATIENNGKIAAGRVLVTADAVRGVVDSAINMSGVTEAKGVTVSGGDIVLDGGAGAVAVTGTLDASSVAAKGGSIQVTGGAVTLASTSTIDASGATGGGTVQVGGGPHGGGTLKHAATVTVAAGARIRANATRQGDGGTVSVWSDGLTRFNGSISAVGAGTGAGGWVETSGHALSIAAGRVDATAPNGKAGSWLLDPTDLTIDAGLAATLETALDGGTNVTEQTSLSGTGGSGDITVAAPVSWSSGASLTLSAYRDIAVDAGLTSTGGGSVTLHADNSGTGVGTVGFANAAKVTTSGAVAILYNPSDNPAGSLVNSTSYTSPTDYSADVAGGATLTASMLVNSVYDLQNVQNNLAGNYAQGRDIDASAAAGWNGGAGFNPIGAYGMPFAGSFNGEGHSIANLTIYQPEGFEIGLFAESTGVLTSVALTNAAVTGGAIVGGLVGDNKGSITGSSVAGTVSATAQNDPNSDFASDTPVLGGLVGQNDGAITGSTSSGTVSEAPAAVSRMEEFDVGGLVGLNNDTIVHSSSSASVFGTIDDADLMTVGGLVGRNRYSVSFSSATGPVQGGNSYGDYQAELPADVGGLIGLNDGHVNSSFSTGSVTGAASQGGQTALVVGGLIGENSPSGVITLSYATGSVQAVSSFFVGVYALGGLVGDSQGAIIQSYATGTVTGQSGGGGGCGDYGAGCPGDSFTGGLAGTNSGTITDSFATGQVIGVDGINLASSDTGGLVGRNGGEIATSYATGAVSVAELPNPAEMPNAGAVIAIAVGGLVGDNSGTISQSYASGPVTGGSGGSPVRASARSAAAIRVGSPARTRPAARFWTPMRSAASSMAGVRPTRISSIHPASSRRAIPAVWSGSTRAPSRAAIAPVP